jgi:hypothetical protein
MIEHFIDEGYFEYSRRGYQPVPLAEPPAFRHCKKYGLKAMMAVKKHSTCE